MIVNPFADKSVRKPNVIQSAFADFFNDINVVRDDIHKEHPAPKQTSRSHQQARTEKAESLAPT